MFPKHNHQKALSKISSNESALVPFDASDPHKIYISCLDIEFNYLETFWRIMLFNKKQLNSNFQTSPLYKMSEDASVLKLIKSNKISINSKKKFVN